MKPEYELAKTLRGPSQLERVRAARALLNGSGKEDVALHGFMAIFHPDYDPEKVRSMARDLKERR
jgi:hypothetical protein